MDVCFNFLSFIFLAITFLLHIAVRNLIQCSIYISTTDPWLQRDLYEALLQKGCQSHQRSRPTWLCSHVVPIIGKSVKELVWKPWPPNSRIASSQYPSGSWKLHDANPNYEHALSLEALSTLWFLCTSIGVINLLLLFIILSMCIAFTGL